MKFSLFLLGLCAIFACSGCESLTDNVREKFVTPPPKTRLFAADSRATYAAARTAVEQIGFRFQRGGPAQGELEAVSGLTASDSLRSSRQVIMKVRLHAALDGGTEVTVRLTEVIETDASKTAGVGTETPLRDTPLYEVYFRSIQQALDAAKKN